MKNNIKRSVSIFLMLAVVISFSNIAYAAIDGSAINEDYNHALELFRILKIIEDYDNFSDTKVISRGYFAMVAARVSNIPFEGMAKEQRFTDVPLYSSYADPIELLANLGAVKGDGTGAFHEKDRIKIIDAVKIMTVIAGYDFIADVNGGYPDGFIDAAAEAGMLKGVGGIDNYLSAESMLVLVANTLNAYTMTSTISDKGASYKKDTSENLLKKLYNVEAIEGVVTQNTLTAFRSASDIGENRIEITSGGKRYIFYTEEYGKYIGQTVKAFYKTDPDDNEIIYAYSVSRRNTIKTLQISDIDLAASSQTEIKYHDGESGKDKSYRCVQDPTVIYNQMYYAEGALDFGILDNKTGTVELIDNNADGQYDIINIFAYDSFIVGNVLLDEQRVFSSSNAYGIQTVEYINGQRKDNFIEVDIDPNHYDYFSMKYEDGSEATALDIIQNHIISVATSSPSASKKTIEIIISRNIQSGRITSIDQNDIGSKCYITIDSRDPFETTADIIDKFELTVGKSISLYMDAFGNVVGASVIAAGYYRYGLMLGYKSQRDELTVRLFTADNEVAEIKAVEKPFIDEVKYNDAETAKNRLEEVKDYIKATQNISIESDPIKTGIYPVRYLINDNGELFKLDTPCKDENESEDGGLLIGESGEYISMYDYVLCEYNVDKPKTIPLSKDATVIWMELSGEPVNDKYSYEGSDYDQTTLEVSDASSLMSSFDYHELYSYRIKDGTDPESPYADLILAVDGTSISSDAYMFMIDKITKAYDEQEGGVLPLITGISQGSKKSLKAAPSFAQALDDLNLKKGDTVRAAISSITGYVDDIRVVSRYGQNGSGQDIAEISDTYSGIKNGTASHKRWLYIGYVAERRGELLKILYKGSGQYSLKPDAGEIMNTDNMFVYSKPSVSTTVTVYDKANDRVFSGTFDDIKDYIHNGDEASRVIVRYDSGSLKEIIVYND